MARKHLVIHEQVNNILKFIALLEHRPEVSIVEEAIYTLAQERINDVQDKHHRATLKAFCKQFQDDQ